MDFKVIRRNAILFFFSSLCWGLVSNAIASTNVINFEVTALSFSQNTENRFYALISQEAKHASDLEIVMQTSMPPRTAPVDPGIDWRDVDWKDPFAPKTGLPKGVDYQIRKSDITIILEQDMSPPSGSLADSYDDLADPFAPRKEASELADPFEGYNRFMFEFNEELYDILEPVARGYRDIMAEDFRIVISNIFDNALAPVKLVSSLLQGDLEKSGRVLSRTLINTTVGLGGMLDVAGEEYDIENVNEDLGQALGFHGVPSGPYVVLPLIGPTTLRGLVGRAGGSFLSPTFHFAPSVEAGASITVSDKINDASFILDDKKQLEESTVDEYESMKDFYNQYRSSLVNK